MKLTGKLKENVEKAETKEQAKELIADAGMELTDDEMDMVSGGGPATKVSYRVGAETITMRSQCRKCGKVYSGNDAALAKKNGCKKCKAGPGWIDWWTAEGEETRTYVYY